jgi:hypothetical protein
MKVMRCRVRAVVSDADSLHSVADSPFVVNQVPEDVDVEFQKYMPVNATVLVGQSTVPAAA